MGSDDGGRKVAVMCAAAGALALSGLAAYYAMNSLGSSGRKNEFDGKVTAAQIVQLLEEIVESQQEMKSMMDDLMKEILASDLSFHDICNLVDQRKPRDLLEEKKHLHQKILESFGGVQPQPDDPTKSSTAHDCASGEPERDENGRVPGGS